MNREQKLGLLLIVVGALCECVILLNPHITSNLRITVGAQSTASPQAAAIPPAAPHPPTDTPRPTTLRLPAITAVPECLPVIYLDPQWSPDGSLIYYKAVSLTSIDLHVMNATGGDDKLLASDVNNPLLSPDGSMVLFQRRSVEDKNAYILDLKTLKTRAVAELGLQPSWSPDSQWFVYQRWESLYKGPLYKVGAATGEAVKLTDTSAGDFADRAMPLWSPDGRTIAYTFNDHGRTVAYLLPADGSGPARGTPLASDKAHPCPLSTGLHGDFPLAWRPDSGALVIGRSCGSESALYVVTTDGREIADLNELGSEIKRAQWSPDGKQLLYYVDRPEGGGLFVANAEPGVSGLDPVRVPDGASQGQWSPGPGGGWARIVFSGMGSAGLEQLFTFKPDGLELTPLTDHAQLCGPTPSPTPLETPQPALPPGLPTSTATCNAVGYINPQWSPDGASIYYTVYPGGPFALRVMTSTGKNDRLLATDIDNPLLSPDGSKVLFGRDSRMAVGQPDAYVLDLSTMQIRFAAPQASAPRWSPDSQWFVYQALGADSVPIFKAHIPTDAPASAPVRIADTGSGGLNLSANPLWSPDGRTIAYTFKDHGLTRTYLAPADGSGQGAPLTSEQAHPCPAGTVNRSDRPVAWRPDSQALAVVQSCDNTSTQYVISTEGQVIADLSVPGEMVSVVQWSPDGKQLLYSTFHMPRHYALYVANADGSNPVLLPHIYTGQWSPDGKRIVVTWQDTAIFPEIDTINPDGTGLTQLTDNPGMGMCACHESPGACRLWSSRGKDISMSRHMSIAGIVLLALGLSACGSSISGGGGATPTAVARLTSLPMATPVPTPATVWPDFPEMCNVTHTYWLKSVPTEDHFFEMSSPDRQYAIYPEGQKLVLKDEASGRTEILSYYRPWSFEGAAWSPNSDRLAFLEKLSARPNDEDVRIVVVDVSQGIDSLRRVGAPVNSGERVNYLDWSPDGAYLAAMVWANSIPTRTVMVWSVRDGRMVFTSQPPPNMSELHQAVWSPDSHRLALLWEDTSGSPGSRSEVVTTVDISTLPVHALDHPVRGPKGALSRLDILGESLLWSPDSRYVADIQVQWIEVFRTDQDEPIRSAALSAMSPGIPWSREGNMVAGGFPYVSWEADSRALRVWNKLGTTFGMARMSIDSLEVVPFATADRPPVADSFAPLVARHEVRSGLVFLALDNHHARVDLITPRGGGIAPFITDAASVTSPSWSPDDGTVAVIWTDEGWLTPRSVWLTWANVAGSTRHDVGGAGYTDIHDLNWSPDSQILTMIGTHGQTASLEMVDLRTGTHRVVLDGMSGYANLRYHDRGATFTVLWQALSGEAGFDGYDRHGNRLFRTPIDWHVVYSGHLIFSPDQRMAAVKIGLPGRESLVLNRMDESPGVTVMTDLAGLGDPLWSPDSQLLAFTADKGAASLSWQVINVQGKVVWTRPLTLEEFNELPRWNLTWAPCRH